MEMLLKCTLLLLTVALVSSELKDSSTQNPLPWIPTWVDCEFVYGVNHKPTCRDCSSTIHCTPRGGIVRYCFGATPYCNIGHCSPIPSKDCAEEVVPYTEDYFDGEAFTENYEFM